MASTSRRSWAGLSKLAKPFIGAKATRKMQRMERPNTLWFVLGGSLVVWAVAGRWLLLPFFGASNLSEPNERRGGSSRRIKRPDGTELQVEFFGPEGAPTLVLTHGWEQNSTGWYYLKRDLAKRFRLIVWDLPGFGESSRPSNGDYSVEKMASDLAAVVELAGRPVVLVGHGLGGMVMQTYCRLYPQHLGTRVTGMVLMDTTYTDPLKTARFSPLWQALRTPVIVPACYVSIALSPLVRILGWLNYYSGSSHLIRRFVGFAGRQTWRQVDFIARLSAEASPTVAAHVSLATLHFDEWETLPKISIPVLILAGETDRVTRIDVNRQIQQRIPGAKLKTFRPGGHYSLYEHHDAFSQAVAEFVDHHKNYAAASSGIEQGSEKPAVVAGRF